MANCFQRGFSGKKIGGIICHQIMLELFKKRYCRNLKIQINHQHPIDLIYQNLSDKNSRHLMILSNSGAIETALVKLMRDFTVNFKCQDPSKFVYLTRGKDQAETIKTIQSKIPFYITNGYTLVLKDLPEIYGALYDLLNKNYSKVGQETKRDMEIERAHV